MRYVLPRPLASFHRVLTGCNQKPYQLLLLHPCLSGPPILATMGTENSKLAILYRSEPYWTARAMQEQGSQFFQHLGAALQAADLSNRYRIFEGWAVECWDFYQRGLELQKGEESSATL